MLHESPAVQPPAWDKLTLALVAIVFLTEAAIAVVFLAIVPQYPVHLLESTPSRTEVTGERLLALAAAFSGYMLSAYGGESWSANPFGAGSSTGMGLERRSSPELAEV